MKDEARRKWGLPLSASQSMKLTRVSLQHTKITTASNESCESGLETTDDGFITQSSLKQSKH
ncbi:hypothetical protein FQA47_005617 [Oryzias melastigma]|uniref:Uncharacterized protein n=1 Tax=Oryzias melastigma TaxID=30732 RepID=A0A834BUB6_ORYME|nr:hypothetical protein FQA47_005617 [Oryzias melastigma]